MEAIAYKTFLYAGTALLVFNMLQRRHQRQGHGERKRMASLIVAGLVLLMAGSTLVLIRIRLNLVYLIIPAAGALIAAYILRDRILLYRLSCRKCGRIYGMQDILFTDDPKCENCTISEKKKSNGDEYSQARKVTDIEWADWNPTEDAVLCFIRDRKNKRILMIHKKTGLGAGKVNAPGGRIEPGETALAAAVRECVEETHIRPVDPVEMVHLSFQFTNGYGLRGRVFIAEKWEGNMQETDEADPFWCDEKEIPYERMWADDILWLPGMLKGEHIHGRFIFNDDEMLDQFVEPGLDKHFCI